MIQLITYQLQNQLLKIVWITVSWTLIALFNYLNVFLAFDFIGYEMAPGESTLFLKGSLISGIFSGVVGGSVIVFLWEKWLRTRSYAQAVIFIMISYTLVYSLVSIVGSSYFYHNLDEVPELSGGLWNIIIELRIFDWVSFIFWLLVILGTLFFLQVNDKYGPGTMLAFMSGKYFRPKAEERIFMFLDLRSSTTIAEKLGEETYFHFLKDLYHHVTQPILNSRGEIYQYIGDEIVISWPVHRGANHANCVNCFFRVQWALDQKKEYYHKKYKVMPEFKAGLHYGKVITGEIGIIKRDITFSGDVLNTTSRIQNQCNELGVNILISQALVQKLNLKSLVFTPKEVGAIILRGKKERMTLYTV